MPTKHSRLQSTDGRGWQRWPKSRILTDALQSLGNFTCTSTAFWKMSPSQIAMSYIKGTHLLQSSRQSWTSGWCLLSSSLGTTAPRNAQGARHLLLSRPSPEHTSPFTTQMEREAVATSADSLWYCQRCQWFCHSGKPARLFYDLA